MSIDVRADHLTMIQGILKQFVPGCRVVTFGSRVTNTASDASDLDLCIIDNKSVSFETLAHLRDAFSESNLPYKVDVIDWSTIAPDFKEIVLQNCFDIQTAA